MTALKRFVWKVVYRLYVISLKKAGNEQDLTCLYTKLIAIVDDLSDQYTNVRIDNSYLECKVRMQHAFQVSLALDAIDSLNKKHGIVLVDIGDSSGTHIRYLQALREEVHAISVNLDPEAVEKIRNKDLIAYQSRAEELHSHPGFDGDVDVFLSFEMLEHLFDPISFMRSMAEKSRCKLFVITVPYIKKSRVGLHQIRQSRDATMYAENTHIFELSPDDWNLLFMLSGWKVVKSIRYTQYPRFSLFSAMRYVWRRFDFDGFYGVILSRDNTYSQQYKDW